MNSQQVAPPRSSSNGYGRRKTERDTSSRFDNKLQGGRADLSRGSFGKSRVLETPSRDRLIYLTTCLIGHQVEVQVTDGSVFSGIFHASNAEDFGVVLKMANLIKDGKKNSDSLNETPSRTLIIPAKDLVQVIAKGVPVTNDGVTKEVQPEKQRELMTDSFISQSRHVDTGRELERWIPDENDPGCPELENIFDDPWNRGWDQFEANESLFGVKSTFDEDLYTTKLNRGPQTRELEKEALRMAREIEGEETLDLHLAEERGIQLDGTLELDEETRFSSVFRGVDDSGYDEIEDILLDSRNDETFGGVLETPLIDTGTRKTSDGTQVSSKSSLMGEAQSSLGATSKDVYHLDSDASRLHDKQFIEYTDSIYTREDKENRKVSDQNKVSKDSPSLPRPKKDLSDKVELSPNATAYDPSHVSSSKGQEKTSSSQMQSEPSKTQGTARPGSSASSTSGRGLTPSSSLGSLTSEKSTLNPHAKEFKFNPNATSFTPAVASPLRASSPVAPVAGSSFYYQPNMNIHGMPGGAGIGPNFAAHQPIIFNPQAAPMPQPFYNPNGHQYGQQMMIGQPRPVYYMPTYPQETPYRGREF